MPTPIARRRRRVMTAASLLTLTLGLAACGSDGKGAADGGVSSAPAVITPGNPNPAPHAGATSPEVGSLSPVQKKA
ncbi:hypothetical protein GCM10010411_24110 [Actinomadura fulvescens]|uniref:ABC transporter substrate-binding protein n=1 Tax=Actinomadura fulvescens TaxID=46160 RepID=A0ABP6C1D2_9ACTN